MLGRRVGRRRVGLFSVTIGSGCDGPATLGFLESVIGGESGHHVRMSGDEDTEIFPETSDRVAMSAMVFIRLAVPLPKTL
jgi:hypothetical protein